MNWISYELTKMGTIASELPILTRNNEEFTKCYPMIVISVFPSIGPHLGIICFILISM